MEDLSAFFPKPRLRLLLDHFAGIKDTRQGCQVAFPLREVLFLVVCGTIASGDDYEDIVDWGEAHLGFLRGFADYYADVWKWMAPALDYSPHAARAASAPAGSSLMR
jgi:hypothetical protein